MSLGKERPIFDQTITTGTHYALWYGTGQSLFTLQMQSIGTATATSIKLYGSDIYTDPTSGTIAASFTNKEWVEIPTTGGTLPAGANWTDAFRVGPMPFKVICVEIVISGGTSAFKVYGFGR